MDITDDQGTVALPAIFFATATSMIAVVLVTVFGLFAVTAIRLGSAAEHAAVGVLSGSVLTGGSGDPRRQIAEDVAALAGGEVSHIDVSEWPVAVEVRLRQEISIPLLPYSVTVPARARAEAHPPD